MLGSIEGEKWLTRMLILLPGFLSLALAQYIGGIGKLDDFEVIAYSLTLSLLNFLLAVTIYRLIAWIATTSRRSRQRTAEGLWPRWPSLSLTFMLSVVFVALAVGIITGVAYQSDTVLRGLRIGPFAKVPTKRSSERPLTFLLAANRQGNLEEGRPRFLKQGQVWLEIHTKDGLVFAGYPEFFSLGEPPGEVFLSPACVIQETTWPWPGPGVLLPESEVAFFAFVDREHSECHNLWRDIDRDKRFPSVTQRFPATPKKLAEKE